MAGLACLMLMKRFRECSGRLFERRLVEGARDHDMLYVGLLGE
jgi:hypothetical protein